MAEGLGDLHGLLRPAGDKHFIANGKTPGAGVFVDDHRVAE